MKYLNHQDLMILLSAIQDLNSDFAPKTLHNRTLAAASKVIDADSIAFTVFRYSGEFSGIFWENSGNVSAEGLEIFTQYMHENPLINALIVEQRQETLKITDLMSAKDFQRTNVYNEFYRHLGVTNQLVVPMLISSELFLTCSINTIKEDFSDRDKLILTLIAPHLANAVRNTFAFERLSSVIETKECGVITINSKAKPLFISEYAQQLLENYFKGEKRETNSLPKSLSSWLKDVELRVKITDFQLPPDSLKIENQQGTLTIRWMYNNRTQERTLLFEEKKALSPQLFEKFNLTQRESEIMFWITQGKTDTVISDICSISLRTVHKHIQNIYIKLGVETRTGAMLKAVEIL